MSTNNIAESIFDAVSLIMENRIQKLEYDKTITCTITDISQASKEDIYTVSDGSITFQARGNGEKFELDDQVRVLIINGDMSKEKFIQGKYSSKDEVTKPLTYVSPLDSVLKITDNLLSANTAATTYGIAANGTLDEVLIANITFNQDEVQNSDIFDTLYLSAEFQTNFDRYDMRSGDYGLHLKLISQTLDDNGKHSYGTYGLYFSSELDMFGNSYAFKIFTLQEIKYALSQWPENIVGLQIYLYQDGNFKYNDGTLSADPVQKYQPQIIDKVEISDIKIKNISIGFGSEVSAEEQSKVKLYTNDLQTYRSDDSNTDTRKLQLLWYNRNENNEYLGFSDGIYDPNYSEDRYLQNIENNTRLLQQQSELYPADEISLSLLADMYDIKNYALTAAKIIGEDLNQTVEGFEDYMFGIDWGANNPFSQLSQTQTGVWAEALRDKLPEDLNNIYNNILGIVVNTEIEAITYTLNVINSAHESIPAQITEAITAIDNLLRDTKVMVVNEDGTPGKYAAYNDVYQTYAIRLNNMKKELLNIKSSITILIGPDTTLSPPAPKEEAKKSLDDIKPEIVIKSVYDILSKQSNAEVLFNIYRGLSNATVIDAIDLSKYTAYADKTKNDTFKQKWDNKYCIYWYRYNKDYAGLDAHMPAGWERLTFYNNYGIPASYDEKTQKLNKKVNSLDSTATVSLNMSPKKSEEKFVAVLFYNHKKFVSNELMFDNLTEIPNNVSIDANGALTLEHYKTTGEKEAKSQDSYQLYGTSGILLNSADAQVKRQLRARFASTSGGDEQLIGATIYWYVPKAATMLEVWDLDVKNEFHDERVTIYDSLDSLNDAYIRKKLLTNRTNVVTINNEYKLCKINSIYEDYALDINCVVSNKNIAEASREANKTYLIKKADEEYVYEIFTNTAAAGADPVWTKSDTTVSKYIYTDAEIKIYTSCPEVEPDNDKTYLIGPTEGPFKEYKYIVKTETENEWVETGYVIDDITTVLINSAIYKPNYYCYYKMIGINESEDSEIQTLKETDTLFPYHIKNYYQQTATQNTILCVVEKNGIKYQTSYTFKFSAYGNSGTDYTLMLTPDPERPMVINSENNNIPLSINIELYDHNKKKIKLPENQSTSVSWFGPTGYKSNDDYKKNNEIRLIKDSNDIYAGILECSIKDVEIEQLNNKKITLTSYLPIAYGNTENLYIEGATSITYDSNGSNPQYYNNPYVLYSKLTNEPLNDITWSLIYYYPKDNKEIDIFRTATGTIIDDQGNIISTYPGISMYQEGAWQNIMPITNKAGVSDDSPTYQEKYSLNYIPRLSDNNILIPSPMYVTGHNIYAVAVAEADSTIMWAQPILVSQNQYSSSIINKWDGGLVVDEKNNMILSAMVGAGRKNERNKFEGVLMGDVGTKSQDNAISEVGLYGFHDGAQSFGFKVDGTAFLGKSGSGRLEFNGNNGYIYSQSWLKSFETINDDGTINPGNPFDDNGNPNRGTAGMLINLQDGTIDAYNFKLTSAGIQLNSNPNLNEYYLYIGTELGSHLSYSQAGVLELASSAFTLTAKPIGAQQETLYYGNTPVSFNVTKGDVTETFTDVIFKAGDNFLVKNTGESYIYSATIQSATIGAFKLDTKGDIVSTYNPGSLGWNTPRLYAACDQDYSYSHIGNDGWSYATIGLYANKKNGYYTQNLICTPAGLSLRNNYSFTALENGELRFSYYLEDGNPFTESYAAIKLTQEDGVNILRLNSFAARGNTDDIRFCMTNGNDRSIRSLITGEYRTDTDKTDEEGATGIIEQATKDLSFIKFICGWYDTEKGSNKQLTFEGRVLGCMAYGRTSAADDTLSYAIPVYIDGKTVTFGYSSTTYADIYYFAFIDTNA